MLSLQVLPAFTAVRDCILDEHFLDISFLHFVVPLLPQLLTLPRRTRFFIRYTRTATEDR